MTSQLERFKKVTDVTYDGCTTEQKLSVYVQHHPAAVVPFLLELLTELQPKLVEDNRDDHQRED